MDEVGDLYLTKAKITSDERRNSRLFWSEFTNLIRVNSVRELNAAAVAEYHDVILARNMSPTYVKHRFEKVKSILNFAKKRGLDATDLRHALDCCAILVAPNSTTLDPHPISRNDFHRLFRAANIKIKALLLLALNCCMYGHEVTGLEWHDINWRDRTLVTDRSKTDVTRIAILWNRTIAALHKLEHTTSRIFSTQQGSAANANIARKWFGDLRTVAKVAKTVKLSDIRDGAYSAAASGEGVDLLKVRILGGHRCGMADHYLKRNPKIVAKACAAVEAEYFG